MPSKKPDLSPNNLINITQFCMPYANDEPSLLMYVQNINKLSTISTQ